MLIITDQLPNDDSGNIWVGAVNPSRAYCSNVGCDTNNRVNWIDGTPYEHNGYFDIIANERTNCFLMTNAGVLGDENCELLTVPYLCQMDCSYEPGAPK